MYDAEARTCVRSAELGAACRAVAISPAGEHLAIGMGAPDAEDPLGRSGCVRIVAYGDLAPTAEMQHASEHVSCLGFSADGALLAAGAADGKVRIYAAAEVEEAPAAETFAEKKDDGHEGDVEEGEAEEKPGAANEEGDAEAKQNGAEGKESGASAIAPPAPPVLPAWKLKGECDVGADVPVQVDFSSDGDVLRVATSAGALLFFRTVDRVVGAPDGGDDADAGGLDDNGDGDDDDDDEGDDEGDESDGKEEGDGEGEGHDAAERERGEDEADATAAADPALPAVSEERCGDLVGDLRLVAGLSWATASCTVEYNVQGAWPNGSAAGPLTSISTVPEAALCVASSADGTISVLNYPCSAFGHERASVPAHAGGCAAAAIVKGAEGPKLVSVGPEDGVVMLWTLEADEGFDSAPEDEGSDDEDDEDGDGDGDGNGDGEDEEVDEGASAPSDLIAYAGDDLEGLEDGAELDVSDAAAASQALADVGGAVLDGPAGGALPAAELQLQWAHGFNGRSCRGNAFYDGAGRIVFSAGAVCVALDKARWKQRFMVSHSAEVTALAQSPAEASLFASGQRGRRPVVHVWSSEDAKVRSTIALPEGSRAVSAIAFCPSAARIAVACCDDRHTVRVYRWADGALVASAPSGAAKVLALCWSSDGQALLQCGVGHFRVWSVRGRMMTGKRGLFGSGARRQNLVCAAFAGDGFVLGGSRGDILRVEAGGRRVAAAAEDAHARGVGALALLRLPDGPVLVSGGADGGVKAWSLDLEEQEELLDGSVDLAKRVAGCFRPQVSALACSADGRKVLVGTRGGELMEVSARTGADMNAGPLVRSHCRGAIGAVAAHPQKAQLASCGDDATLRVWALAAEDGARAHTQLGLLPLPCEARSCAFAPDGHFIAVGLRDGEIRVVATLDPETSSAVQPLSVARVVDEAAGSAVDDVAFSPDGSTLAAVSASGAVHFFDALQDFAPAGQVDAGVGALVKVDWASDDSCVQVCAASGAVAYVGRSDLRASDAPPADASWHGYSLPVGGPVEKCGAGAGVSAVATSGDGKLLLLGDSGGGLRLAHSPAGRRQKAYRAHGSRVASCAFSLGDALAASADEASRAIFVWRLQRGEEATAQPAAGDADDDVLKGLGRSDAEPSAPPAAPLDACGCSAAGLSCAAAYNSARGVCYAAGRSVVVCDGAAQRLYGGHAGRVSCVAVSPSGDVGASGEALALGGVHLWGASDAAPVAALPASHAGGVAALAFSPSGGSLAAVGALGDVTVWEASAAAGWHRPRKLAAAAGDDAVALFVTFIDEHTFAVGGASHLRFFDLASGGQLSSAPAAWGEEAPAAVLRAAAFRGGLVTGTADGRLVTWEGRRASGSVQAHARAVTGLAAAGAELASCCAGGSLKVWDQGFGLSFGTDLPEAHVRTLAAAASGGISSLLLAGRGGEVVEVAVENGAAVTRVRADHAA